MHRRLVNPYPPLCHAHTARMPNPTCGYALDGASTENSSLDGTDAGNVTCGLGLDTLFDKPQRVVTVSSLLKRIGNAKCHLVGHQVHHHVVECGHGWESLLRNCLMHMYGKCGLVQEAQATFDRLPNHDTFSWNILINVYGRNLGIEHAKRVFNMMPSPNVVSWNVVLALLTMNEQHKQAFDAFARMQIEAVLPNEVTLISVTDACSTFASLKKGKRLHAIVRSAGYECFTIVGTALINMYGTCGHLYTARNIFSTLPCQDVVSWTALIGGLVENGCNEEALECLQNMQSEGVSSNDITFIHAMEACGNMPLLEVGLEIHHAILIMCFDQKIKVRNALIDIYSKCGNLGLALRVFKSTHQRSDVTWNAMIAAFGQHGCGKEALALFWRMQAHSIKPDVITFISVMNACSHVGLVEEGWCLFLHMYDGGYAHEIDHYVCIIDLLGRAGRLDEAEEVVLKCPSGSGLVAWLCLLAACKLHGNAEKGSYAAGQCFKLDQTHSAAYIVLSNIYVDLVFSDLQDL
ncbi:hypothetical protein GOP47_0003500 [Adiantum capillus-veneris]|uniref:Pentatricopeptide repeat-containing protein n=1 Tax=Adiantum capillus-veneris TaxID=13818 RepID=A0A9D4VE45_ADICA|nr:hypothetical protein GOP47_0003500 [Adiantum capillus-veneris]